MWRKVELYILSLWILFFLVFVNTVPVGWGAGSHFVGWRALFTVHIVPVVAFLLIILGFVFFRRFNYRVIKGAPLNPKTVVKAENLNFETLSFLVTYIVPLVCFNLNPENGGNRNLVMMVLVLFLMGWIYVKTNMFYQNPTLAVLGFNVYRVDTKESQNIVVIIKGKLVKGDVILARPVDENIYFAKHDA